MADGIQILGIQKRLEHGRPPRHEKGLSRREDRGSSAHQEDDRTFRARTCEEVKSAIVYIGTYFPGRYTFLPSRDWHGIVW